MLVFSAPQRNSSCLVALLSLPLLHAVHSLWTLPNSLHMMVAPPVPTPPSKCQASLGLKIATKEMTGFGLHLPCDFLSFPCKISDSPKYPHRLLFLLQKFHSEACPSNSECFPRTSLRLLFLSQLFFPQYQCGCPLQLLTAKILLEVFFIPGRSF